MARARLFIIDDDRDYCEDLALVLGSRFSIEMAHNGADALQRLPEVAPDAIVLDVNLGRESLSGLEILERLPKGADRPPVIMLSGKEDPATVVSAIKLGARDFLPKPADVPALIGLIERALTDRRQLREARAHRSEVARLTGSFVAGDDKTWRLLEQLEKVAETDATVLITGESGTGKEMIARRVHEHSRRGSRAFVGLNCAAVPGDLIESEIFGYRKGAFTGADADRIGKFELASAGTLFLDEIGESPAAFQVKLLKALDHGMISRLGENREIVTDARIVAATSRDLESAMDSGAFRPDLYYRLNVYRVHLPPLAERPGDILPLAHRFLIDAAVRSGRPVEGMSPAFERYLTEHPWPGNVRQLRNEVERAVINARTPVIGLGDAFSWGVGFTAPLGPYAEAKKDATLQWQKSYWLRQLTLSRGNISTAAEAGGIHRQALQRMLKELDIDPADFHE